MLERRGGGSGSGSGSDSGGDGGPAAAIVTNLPAGDAPVPVDTRVQVEAQDGTLSTVLLTTADGTEVAGEMREGASAGPPAACSTRGRRTR
ncbi:Ig-like domain-containing protein [Nocardioides zeae]